MRILRSCAGAAAVEMGLIAPIIISMMIFMIDVGVALLSQAQIAQALATSAEYATLAGQNSVASATIAANAKTYASAVSNAFLGTPTVTAVVNNGAGTGAKCCIGSSWSCSTTTTSCADGSTPGSYLKVTAQYPFKTLFPTDTYLLGTTLSDTIVAPLQ